MTKVAIDTNVLRQELSVLTYAQLEEKYSELGFTSIWKKGANKQSAVEKLIGAIVEQNSVEEQVEIPSATSEVTEEGIPVGEWDVDEDLLDEFPDLVKQGFNVGDVLVHEEGKPFFKKEVEQNTESEEVNQNLFEKVGFKKEETELEESVEKVYEYEPEVIDETKFSVEELEENLQICMLNAKQAIPSTRIILLRKAEAIQVALDKKK